MLPRYRIEPIGPRAMLLIVSALLAACSTNSTVVPPSLKTQVDHNLTFTQIKESPDTYRGHIVVVGGEVLSAKRLKDGTRLEILQLPLNDQEPLLDKTKSQGRFVAIQKDFLDPATLPKDTRVTIVGEITGTMTLPLDETEYTYPVLDVKNLTVWPDRMTQIPPYYYGPYMGPYYWGPYWGPGWRGYWYSPYWW